MKKYILLYILLLIPFISIGQSKQFEIYWNDIDQQNSETSTQNIIKKYSPGLIDVLIDQDMSYYIQWEDTNYVDEKSLEISNIRYDNLSSHELKIAQKEPLLDKHTSVLKSGKARDKLYSSVSINPIIKVNGVYKKIISFKVSYSYDNSNRPQKVIPLTNSVLASGDWYKFKVDQTGVYRINKSFLNSIGMNTDNVDPRTIKIFGNGGKALPFKNIDNNELDLIENSIQIVGEEDGSFDSNDFILFYGVGTKGYQGEHFDTNINPYSDQSFYYVTSICCILLPKSTPEVT